MNLVLCGMMGAGKTTVGAKIAQMAGWNCVDTDVLIAEKYGEISGIFKTHGEAYFRGLETEIVKELAGQDHLVVATGGGLVLKAEKRCIVKAKRKNYFPARGNGYAPSTIESGYDKTVIANGRTVAHALKSIVVRTYARIRTRGGLYRGR